MTNKHMKRCPISLIIRKMLIEITKRCDYIRHTNHHILTLQELSYTAYKTTMLAHYLVNNLTFSDKVKYHDA